MLLLILLALLAAIFFGLGFTIKWLFILAIIAALLWVITLFTGASRRSSTRLLVVTACLDRVSTGTEAAGRAIGAPAPTGREGPESERAARHPQTALSPPP